MAELGDDVEFEGGDAQASKTIPAQASSVRKNGYILIKNRPVKVVEMSTSKTGKHGHAKIHFVGIDIFTGKKYEDIVPSTHNLDVPHVQRKEYQLLDISDDDFLSIMDECSELRDDIRLPAGDLGADIKARFDKGEQILVTVLKAMEEEMAISCKAMPTK